MRLLTILLGIVLFLNVGSNRALTQETDASADPGQSAQSGPETSSENVSTQSTTPEEDGDFISINGKKIPLPKDLLDALQTQESTGREIPLRRNGQSGLNTYQVEEELPAVIITSINVTGTVREAEEIAELELTYKIQVNSDEAAYTELLGAPEGILTDFETDGPGYVKHARTDPEKGYYWTFLGKGRYEVKLFLDVKIRVVSSSPTLRLTLPTKAAIRNATLLLPLHNLEVTLPENTLLKKRELETDQTEVNFPILGDALNLTWKFTPLVKDKQVVLQAKTDIDLNFLSNGSETSVQMKVKQTVQPDEQGSFKTLRIRLPRDFDVDGVSGKDYLKHEKRDNQELIVFLKEPATGPVTFEYDLELAPLESNELVLDGAFQLLSTTGSATAAETSTQTLEQSGTITIQKGESFLIRGDQEQRLIRHQSTKSLDPELPISQAFRFLGQPFRLKLEIEEIPPLSSVDAHYKLNVAPDRVDTEKLSVELKAGLKLEVLRGELNELNLDWQNFAAEGWSEPTIDLDGPIENLIEKMEYNTETGQLLIRFLDPITEEKLIRFESEKTIDLNNPEFDFSLPQLSEEIRRTVVSVISPPNLATELTPVGKTKIDPLSTEEQTLFRLPESATEHSPPLQRMITSARQSDLHLKVTQLKRRITARTVLKLRELIRDSLEVRQEIELDVKNDPLKILRLKLPEELADADFEIRDAEGNIINPEKTTAMENILEILVPSGQGLGASTISIHFQVNARQAAAEGVGQVFPIPYFRVESTPFENVTLSTSEQSQYVVDLGADDWKPIIQETNNTWQLSAENPESYEITVAIRPIKATILQDFQVALALYDIDLRSQDKTLIDARYLIEGSPEQIILTLPDKSRNVSARWDGVDLTQTPENGKQEWLLNIPTSEANGRHRLSISYQLDQTGGTGWLRNHRVEFPGFAEGIWTTQTIAEVTCPHAQHLLSPPEKWSPMYAWQWEGIFWYRRSNVDKQNNEMYQELRGEQPFSYHYQYDFSRPAVGQSLSFRTISLSMLVFCGAGTALFCGFLFRRLRALHNSLAFALLLFLIAFAGLWYWPMIQLFLQPALIGVLFALAAVGIEELLKRRHKPEYEEPGSSIDFVLKASRNSGILSRQIGSEDSTAVRVPSDRQISVGSTVNKGES